MHYILIIMMSGINTYSNIGWGAATTATFETQDACQKAEDLVVSAWHVSASSVSYVCAPDR